MNQLFSVQYRLGAMHPPLVLICQALSAGEELLLWMDGLNLDDPVVVPISACRQIKPMGTFRDFARGRLDHARAVLEESQGEHSPTLLARAMQCMAADPQLSAADALELVSDQALDIIDADTNSASVFASVLAELAAA